MSTRAASARFDQGQLGATGFRCCTATPRTRMRRLEDVLYSAVKHGTVHRTIVGFQGAAQG